MGKGELPGVGAVRTWKEAGPGESRPCTCGCESGVTHYGLANGTAVVAGCYWRIRLWVKDPTSLTPAEQEMKHGDV